MSELQPGDLIADRFRIEALLGEGGIARVYRVRHTRLGSTHALKILHMLKPALADRLLLEGRIQAQLHHPNLVRVTDVVEHQGMPCLVMEYVAGTQLQALLQEHGALPLDVGLHMFAGILSAVATAHDLGVLHRDLKPANILLTRQGDRWLPKVSDFGIAKIASGGLREGETQAGMTMGTPGYMAPEQIEDSSQIDHRADIFALGALLYEMLSGMRPFAQETTYKTLRATIEGRLQPLATLRPDVPAHIAKAVHRCLAVEMDDRFSDCHALADALFVDQPSLRALVSKLESEAIPEGLQRPETTDISTSSGRPPGKAPATQTSEAALPSPPQPLMPLGSGATLVADPTDLPAFDPAAFSPASQNEADERRVVNVAGPAAGVPIRTDAGTEDELEPQARPRRELPIAVLGGIAALACAIVLGGWWMTRPAPTSTPTPTTSVASEGLGATPTTPVDAEPVPAPASAPPPTPPTTAPGQPTPPGVPPVASTPGTVQPGLAPSLTTPPAAVPVVETAATASPEPTAVEILLTEPATDGSAGEALQPTSQEPDPGSGADIAPEATGEPTPATEEAVAEAEPAAEPAPPPIPQVLGSWSGTANKLPLTVQITSQDGERISGTVFFTQGEDEQAKDFTGTISAESNRLSLSVEGGLVFYGVVRGTGMMGTYGASGKNTSLSWSAQKR